MHANHSKIVLLLLKIQTIVQVEKLVVILAEQVVTKILAHIVLLATVVVLGKALTQVELETRTIKIAQTTQIKVMEIKVVARAIVITNSSHRVHPDQVQVVAGKVMVTVAGEKE